MKFQNLFLEDPMLWTKTKGYKFNLTQLYVNSSKSCVRAKFFVTPVFYLLYYCVVILTEYSLKEIITKNKK